MELASCSRIPIKGAGSCLGGTSDGGGNDLLTFSKQGVKKLDMSGMNFERQWVLSAGKPILTPAVVVLGRDSGASCLVCLRGSEFDLYSWCYEASSTHAGTSVKMKSRVLRVQTLAPQRGAIAFLQDGSIFYIEMNSETKRLQTVPVATIDCLESSNILASRIIEKAGKGSKQNCLLLCSNKEQFPFIVVILIDRDGNKDEVKIELLKNLYLVDQISRRGVNCGCFVHRDYLVTCDDEGTLHVFRTDTTAEFEVDLLYSRRIKKKDDLFSISLAPLTDFGVILSVNKEILVAIDIAFGSIMGTWKCNEGVLCEMSDCSMVNTFPGGSFAVATGNNEVFSMNFNCPNSRTIASALGGLGGGAVSIVVNEESSQRCRAVQINEERVEICRNNLVLLESQISSLSNEDEQVKALHDILRQSPGLTLKSVFLNSVVRTGLRERKYKLVQACLDEKTVVAPESFIDMIELVIRDGKMRMASLLCQYADDFPEESAVAILRAILTSGEKTFGKSSFKILGRVLERAWNFELMGVALTQLSGLAADRFLLFLFEACKLHLHHSSSGGKLRSLPNRFPSFSICLDWLGVLIDTHLSNFILSSVNASMLVAIENLVKSELKLSSLYQPVQGYLLMLKEGQTRTKRDQSLWICKEEPGSYGIETLWL
uniref:Uncharacterized protein n=1 Tax=Palpitomonas bilix TaxID=652834 RepID=A0A7S3DGQ4_9EUKA|mmetsp:Transcript_37071/g.96077  ORF Transcript_37071/g.96077 Transcript_37071/m.96077 type:complete len:657 (+) Transcript_37071:132-2102(+)